MDEEVLDYKEKLKKSLVSIAKWASKECGMRVRFSGNDQTIKIEGNSIIAPREIPLELVKYYSKEIMHMCLHKTMTPSFLQNLGKDSLEKRIIHSVEDARINKIVAKKMNGFPFLIADAYQDIHFITQEESNAASCLGLISNNEMFKARPTSFKKFLFDFFNAKFKDTEKVVDLGIKAAELFDKAITSLSKKDSEKYLKYIEYIKDLLKEEDEKKESEKEGDKTKTEGHGGKEKQKYNSEFTESSPSNKDPLNKDSGKGSDKSEHNINMTDYEDEISLSEETRQRVKEELKQKIKHEVEGLKELNTNNLMSFFTGEVDDLFKEDTHLKEYKTKVFFLLDASGSMDSEVESSSNMVESGQNKQSFTLTDMIKISMDPVVNIIKEVMQESYSIDYDIYPFSSTLLPKLNNVSSLTNGGGTDLSSSLNKLFSIIKESADYDRKLVVVCTDGEIDDADMASLSKNLKQKDDDIRITFLLIRTSSLCIPEKIRPITSGVLSNINTADVEILKSIENIIQ